MHRFFLLSPCISRDMRARAQRSTQQLKCDIAFDFRERRSTFVVPGTALAVAVPPRFLSFLPRLSSINSISISCNHAVYDMANSNARLFGEDAGVSECFMVAVS